MPMSSDQIQPLCQLFLFTGESKDSMSISHATVIRSDLISEDISLQRSRQLPPRIIILSFYIDMELFKKYP